MFSLRKIALELSLTAIFALCALAVPQECGANPYCMANASDSDFYIDYTNGLSADINGKKTAPKGENFSKAGADKIEFAAFSKTSFLKYPSNGVINLNEGTVELVFRTKRLEQRQLGHQSLLSFWSEGKEVFFLRFFSHNQIYYKPGGYIKYKANLTEGAIWHHLALQWNFADRQNGFVSLVLDGSEIFKSKDTDFPLLSCGEVEWLCVGADDKGNWPAVDFEIMSVAVSKKCKYDEQSAMRIRAQNAAQQSELIIKAIDDISSQSKGFVTDEELSELKAHRAAAAGAYKLTEALPEDIEGSLQSLKTVSDSVDKIKSAAVCRRWDADNASNARVRSDSGCGVFFEPAMRKICPFKDSYKPSGQNNIVLHTAMNEYEPFQIVIASFDGKPVEVDLRISDIKSKTHNAPAADVTAFRVEAIAGRFADIMTPVEDKEVIGFEQVGSFWFNVYTPRGFAPGKYTGRIEIIIDGKDAVVLPYTIYVWNFELPVQSRLKTAFGLSPEYIEAWTPQMAEKTGGSLTDDYIEFMLKHRTSPKALFRPATILTEQARRQAEEISGLDLKNPNSAAASNVDFFHPRQILKKDGSILLDFTEFDKLVERYLPLGLNSFIAGNRYWDAAATQSSLRNHKYRLWVFDEQSGEQKAVYLDVLSDEYKKIMASVFNQWQLHLEKKGWLDMAYGYIVDEPKSSNFALVSEIYAIAKKAAPKIPLMVTHKPDNAFSNIDIWCPTFHQNFTPNIDESVQSVLESGGQMWYYVCNVPERPYGNFFLWQDSIEHRIVFWQTFKYGGSGFLFWEIAFWKEADPWAGVKGKEFPLSMDGSLLYPGANGPIGSLRYEIIREGIEDFDYLALLRNALKDGKLSDSDKKPAAAIIEMAGLVDSPTEFCRRPELLIKAREDMGWMMHRAANNEK